MQAIESLPSGYWYATEQLVIAVIKDTWSVFEFVVGLIL